jgi:hypothetical protein
MITTNELPGGIGLLISRYAFYAALLLAIVMVGAIVAHATVLGGSPAPAIVLLVFSGIIAYLRKPKHHQQRTKRYDHYFRNRRQYSSGPVF